MNRTEVLKRIHAAGLTQSKIARRLKFNRSYISDAILGRRAALPVWKFLYDELGIDRRDGNVRRKADRRTP